LDFGYSVWISELLALYPLSSIRHLKHENSYAIKVAGKSHTQLPLSAPFGPQEGKIHQALSTPEVAFLPELREKEVTVWVI